MGDTTTERDEPRELADGVELIGEFKDSGYKDPPYLARRSDGQVIQLTALLYHVAEGLRTGGTYDRVADEVGEAIGRGVGADDVRVLEDKLEPLGLLKLADGSEPEVRKHEGFLQLDMRTGIVPERVVRRVTALFGPLFHPVLVVSAVVALVAFDIWFFFIKGIGESLRAAVYAPAVMLLVLGLVVLSAAFHESGHATGCRYGGAEPGVMGAGVYLVWPVFYTNVTDSYRLSKGGRLRVDLGGVYFNVLFTLVTAGVYALTRFEPLLLVVLVQHMEMLRQFMPFVRLDGYYVVSDLTGVPDLFMRMKPILQSALPGREADERVTQLKPWVRVAVTAWVLSVIPILAFNVVVIVINLPRIIATTADSLLLQWGTTTTAAAAGEWVTAAAGGFQSVLLVLPAVGISYMTIRVGKAVLMRLWRAVKDRPVARGAAGVAFAGMAAVAAFVVWPNGDYRPLQDGELYRVQDFATTIRHIPSGRPGLTEEREAELGGAPWRAPQAAEEGDATPTDPPASPSASPSPSPSASPSVSPSASPSVTPSRSPSASPSASGGPFTRPSVSPSASPDAAAPPSSSPTVAPSPTASATSTPSPTPSPSPTSTTDA